MSSSTTLGRSRSLRKPAPPIGGADAAVRSRSDKDATTSSAPAPGGLRNASPSRLPVKPSTSAGNARPPPPPASTAAPGTKSRPISGILGRAPSVRQAKAAAAQDQAETATKNSFTARPGRAPSVTTASTRAPASRPTTSGGLPAGSTAKPRAIGHSRAKSSATALTSSTVLRPPSAASSGTSSSTTSRPPVTRANPPITTTHRRQLSQPAVSSSAATTTSAPGQASRIKPASATDDAPRLRPAFTTLQQHYSPARNLAPKPLTATFLAPPSPSKLPSNVAISAETAKLQTELLQLHLLHRDSAVVDQAWRASARQKLGERFAALVKENQDLSREEADVIERRNIAALQSWGGTSSGGGRSRNTALEEKIQVLDPVLSGLWSLGEPGGKYARVIRRFERWAERMVDVVEARRRGGGLGVLDGEEIMFVGELDSAWKDECAGLARKLDGWRRQLKELGDVPDDAIEETTPVGGRSSLAQILDGCRGLVHDMLAELNIMEQIERDALKQEADWIQKMNRDETDDDMPKAGAIWRAF